MTVSYNLDVSSVSSLTFFKLLFRWRGSIYKSIITELIVWLFGYYTVFIVYRKVLDGSAQRQFERIAEYCDKKLEYIPLTFMLGFFVTIVVDRWRSIFQNMGWIENLALTINTYLRGDSKKVILYRRSMIRYCTLSQVMVFRDVSLRVRRRFPTMESLIAAGFLHENELRDLENIKTSYNKYWAPLSWALTISMQAYKEGHIEALLAAYAIETEIKNFRTNLALLCNFDWVPIPIAYPQVVFLAVRMYFLICTVSRQFILNENASNKSIIDLYVPFMTILQFVFLVGWMKVAEALLNPLGEDDDDFECNFLIDKNIATGLCIVDDSHDVCPELRPDKLDDTRFLSVYSGDYQPSRKDSALLGSAEAIDFGKENDQLRGIGVGIVAPGDKGVDTRQRRMSSIVAKKLSTVLEIPSRSHSIKPVDLGSVHRLPFDYTPPHVTVDCLNGSNKNNAAGISKVDEESDQSGESSPNQGKTSKITSGQESAVRK